MLDNKTIEVIKGTVPLLKEKGIEIITTYYKTMFKNNPEVKPLFNMERQASGVQQKALAEIFIFCAENIDRLEVLLPAIKKIGEVHCDKEITELMYPIVGRNLLIAFKEILGDDATNEVVEAWKKGFEEITNVFVDVERKIYLSRRASSWK